MSDKMKEETVDVVKRDIISLVKMAQKPFTWLHGSMAVFNILCLIVAMLLGTYYYKKTNNHSANMEHELELLNAHYLVQNQQTILLKVIDNKMKDVTIDTKVQLAKTIYDISQLKQIPINIICGLIEVESNWNPNVASECGAQGLMQVLPSYARPYLREKTLNYRLDIWKDPIINVIVGVSMLRDFQDEHIEKGKTSSNEFKIALHSYFWGPTNTEQLFGKKDGRVNIPNMSYPIRVLEVAKKYKNLGL